MNIAETVLKNWQLALDRALWDYEMKTDLRFQRGTLHPGTGNLTAEGYVSVTNKQNQAIGPMHIVILAPDERTEDSSAGLIDQGLLPLFTMPFINMFSPVKEEYRFLTSLSVESSKDPEAKAKWYLGHSPEYLIEALKNPQKSNDARIYSTLLGADKTRLVDSNRLHNDPSSIDLVMAAGLIDVDKRNVDFLDRKSWIYLE